MEILIAALIGMAQSILTEIAKKMNWKKEYVLLTTTVIVGILVVTFQRIFGDVVWEEAVGFTMQVLAFATVIYLAFIKPATKNLVKKEK